jgi:hypothetical protein
MLEAFFASSMCFACTVYSCERRYLLTTSSISQFLYRQELTEERKAFRNSPLMQWQTENGREDSQKSVVISAVKQGTYGLLLATSIGHSRSTYGASWKIFDRDTDGEGREAENYRCDGELHFEQHKTESRV